MFPKLNRPHRYTGLAVTASAALGFALLAPPLAYGADVTNPALVDPTKPGTIYITKTLTPATPSTTQDNGMPNSTVDTSAGNVIGGVTFTVYTILDGSGNPIDLSTPDGWENIYINPPNMPITFNLSTGQVIGNWNDAWQLGTSYTCTTSATDGTCNVPNLPMGWYYVVETNVPSGVTPSAPFTVTMPMTNSTGNGWIPDAARTGYGVYVYPKNDKVTASKTAQDPTSVVVGGQIPYTITADIPEEVMQQPYSSPDDQISAFMITDTLDPRLTPPATSAVTVTIVDNQPAGARTASGAITTAPTLIAGTDYNVLLGTDGQTLQVQFTATGLDKLGQAGWSDMENGFGHTGFSVQVQFSATVNSNLDTQSDAGTNAGVISNVATLYPDQSSIDQAYNQTTPPGSNPAYPTPTPTPPGTTPTPTPPVNTYYGGVNIWKSDINNNVLNGAQFQIYSSLAAADAGTGALTAQTVSGSAASTFTTGDASQGNDPGATGVLGLWYTDNLDQNNGNAVSNCSISETGDITFADGGAMNWGVASGNASPAGNGTMYGTTYYVVETQAPPATPDVAPMGYALLPAPFEVCVVGVLDGDSQGASYDDWAVYNIPNNGGYSLPFTGLFDGHFWPMVGVGVLVAGGAIYAIRSRKPQNA